MSFLALLAALAAPTPAEVFESRILPIFKSPSPSSCVQCHLAGVELKNYILPTSDATFASMRDQGLIDLDAPEKSKILALIKMGDGDKASPVHQKTREQELAAFADWVKRSAADPRMRKLPKADKSAGPARPPEVLRHARKDRLLESFVDNIWSMRFRCMSCHTEGNPASEKLVKEHGPRVAWFKKAGPEATLEYLRRSRLIDVDAPAKSLLLTKPLNEVKHGGGVKFVKGDQGHTTALAFLEDYARIVKDGYPDAKSLPAPPAVKRFGTEAWLKLTNTPDAWADKVVQMDVHARDGDGWGATPVATTDRKVWGKGKLWQHALTLLAPRGSEQAAAWAKGKPTLPRGRYLLKVYLAGEKPTYLGQVEVSSAWPEGYGKMTAVDAAGVKK